MRNELVEQISLALQKAISRTLESMFFMEVLDVELVDKIEGELRFCNIKVDTKVISSLQLAVPDSFLRTVSEVAFQDQDVNFADVADDLLAEIMNMFAGCFFAEFNQEGIQNFELHLPEIAEQFKPNENKESVMLKMLIEEDNIYIVAS